MIWEYIILGLLGAAAAGVIAWRIYRGVTRGWSCPACSACRRLAARLRSSDESACERSPDGDR
jgi:hypothetical protein